MVIPDVGAFRGDVVCYLLLTQGCVTQHCVTQPCREPETLRLKRNFEGGINSILISPRRWGKTSLVKHVCGQVDRNKVIPVFLDMFSCRSEYEFYNVLAAAVIKQTATSAERWMDNAREFLMRLTPKISIGPEPMTDFSLSLGITPKTHTPEEILQLAETIAIKRQKRIVVCIDELTNSSRLASLRTR